MGVLFEDVHSDPLLIFFVQVRGRSSLLAAAATTACGGVSLETTSTYTGSQPVSGAHTAFIHHLPQSAAFHCPLLTTQHTQLALTLTLTRVLSKLFSFMDQPVVIGEVVAGVIMGPSVLGHIPGVC